LPGELILHILSFLDVPQVLSLRQTCTLFGEITQTRLLWLTFLRRQQKTLPLPSHLSTSVALHSPSEPSCELPDSILESGVVSAYRIARSWAQPRTQQPIKLTPKPGDSLLSFEIFLDRWLLCAYSEGLVYLWDICASRASYDSTPSHMRCSASLDLGSKNWASVVSALCPSNEHVVLALTRASIPAITRVYGVQLRHSESIFDPNEFQLLHTLVSPVAQIARTIEPALQLLILSSANTVDVSTINGLDGSSPLDTSGKTINTLMSISTQTDDLDELLNGVVGSRIMGPYVVLFKSRSIELYPLVAHRSQGRATSNSHQLQVLEHQFSTLTFRSLSSSDCVLTEGNLSFSFLAYDFLQGMFQFNVSVSFISTLPDGHASLNVDCIGIYPMADNINMDALFTLSSSASALSIASAAPAQLSNPTPAPADSIVRPLHMGIFGPTSGSASANTSSRGFLSTMALGPQGKRAVWVERRRGSTLREVLVWNKVRGIGQDGILIPGKVVYRIQSYDLR
ncbi:hypothetical protein FPV67DRAFT_1397803, partial [Lyophyllum atratum]